MIFRFRDTDIFYNSFPVPGTDEGILFIHGFTGDGSEWEPVIKSTEWGINCAVIDLPGSGKSGVPMDRYYYTAGGMAELIKEFCGYHFIKKPILCGYSMGGRLVFNTVVRFTDIFSGLVIESATPGIRDNQEREARREGDEQLAAEIRKTGIREFMNKWLRTGIFTELKNKLPAEKFQQLIEKRSQGLEEGFINLLLNFGAGKVDPVWDKLNLINVPSLFISGEDDVKYTEILREVNSVISGSRHVVVPETGHNVHLERPDEFAEIIKDFIKHIKK